MEKISKDTTRYQFKIPSSISRNKVIRVKLGNIYLDLYEEEYKLIEATLKENINSNSIVSFKYIVGLIEPYYLSTKLFTSDEYNALIADGYELHILIQNDRK